MVSSKSISIEVEAMVEEPVRILLIPSSDYLGHPFPQRHNHLFERVHDGKEFEVHVIRFNIFGKPKLTTKCIVHEIPLELRIGKTGLYYLANVFSYTHEILRIVREESIDVVFAGNLLPPLTYEVIKRLMERRISTVFDLQDYYPTSATGYLADVKSVAGSMLKGLFEAMTRFLIRGASVVTVPGIALAMYSRRVGARKVYIVPNGISEHFLERYSGEEVRKRLGFGDEDFVVGYVGSIEFWLDMEPLIKGVAMARERGLTVKLLLIGKQLQSGYPQKVRKWLEMYRVEDATTWLDFVPHTDVPKYVAAMDLATIPFDVENPTAFYAAPNKLWEYLSQGTPVAATPIPETIAYKHIKKIHIVSKAQDYIKAIELAGKDREKVVHPEVSQMLKARLWQNSAQKLKQILKSLYKDRKH
jgi:glycosyltransferase involved in cell wall biosynthesis